MDAHFDWEVTPTTDQREAVEEEIREALGHCLVQPCHGGDITVSLRIEGELNTELNGVAKCRCGKSLLSFHGDDHAHRLHIEKLA
jgi:hypothetical protein